MKKDWLRKRGSRRHVGGAGGRQFDREWGVPSWMAELKHDWQLLSRINEKGLAMQLLTHHK